MFFTETGTIRIESGLFKLGFGILLHEEMTIEKKISMIISLIFFTGPHFDIIGIVISKFSVKVTPT